MSDSKSKRKAPSEAQIYATASVITASYRQDLDPEISVRELRFKERASIVVSIDGLDEPTSFLDIDADGVYLHGTSRYSKMLTRSLGNVVKVVEDSRSSFERIVALLRVRRLARRADDAMSDVTRALYEARGLPLDHEPGLPFTVDTMRQQQTRLTLYIPNERLAEIREDLERVLGELVDLIGAPKSPGTTNDARPAGSEAE